MNAKIVLLAAIAFAVAPFFSPEFGGIPPEIYPVPQDDPPVQPAGYAFAIWGVIYLWLVLHAVLGVFRYKDDPVWENGRGALSISLGVGAFWLPVALVSPIWATILIWIMLVAALISLYQMRDAKPEWIAVLPVGLYAGWLSAASFVSIGLLLAGYGILSEFSAALIALVLALVFALVHQRNLGIWTYGLAVGWGFLGIAVANSATIPLVTVLAAGAALSSIIAMIRYS